MDNEFSINERNRGKEGKRIMKIYLATAYNHNSELVRKLRFRMVNYAAAELMEQGHIVFSPISHSHPISICTGVIPAHDFWLR